MSYGHQKARIRCADTWACGRSGACPAWFRMISDHWSRAGRHHSLPSASEGDLIAYQGHAYVLARGQGGAMTTANRSTPSRSPGGQGGKRILLGDDALPLRQSLAEQLRLHEEF